MALFLILRERERERERGEVRSQRVKEGERDGMQMGGRGREEEGSKVW